jgi:hypothetical protein
MNDARYWKKNTKSFQWELCYRRGQFTGVIGTFAVEWLHPITANKLISLVKTFGCMPEELLALTSDDELEKLPDNIIDVMC